MHFAAAVEQKQMQNICFIDEAFQDAYNLQSWFKHKRFIARICMLEKA